MKKKRKVLRKRKKSLVGYITKVEWRDCEELLEEDSCNLLLFNNPGGIWYPKKVRITIEEI